MQGRYDPRSRPVYGSVTLWVFSFLSFLVRQSRLRPTNWIHGPTSLWPSCIMYYRFHSDLRTYDCHHQLLIDQSTSIWHTRLQGFQSPKSGRLSCSIQFYSNALGTRTVVILRVV